MIQTGRTGYLGGEPDSGTGRRESEGRPRGHSGRESGPGPGYSASVWRYLATVSRYSASVSRALPSPHPPWGAPRGQSIGAGQRAKAGNGGLWITESPVDNRLRLGGLCASDSPAGRRTTGVRASGVPTGEVPTSEVRASEEMP